MPGLPLTLGTVANPDKVLILRRPGCTVGFIGNATPGASPFTYTNNDVYIEIVCLVGGTVTDVLRNGQSLGTERVHYLAPGDAITISHITAPSIKRFALS